MEGEAITSDEFIEILEAQKREKERRKAKQDRRQSQLQQEKVYRVYIYTHK